MPNRRNKSQTRFFLSNENEFIFISGRVLRTICAFILFCEYKYKVENTMQNLDVINENLYLYGGSILMCLGTIGGILNIFVFIHKKLRKNSCSICLIAFNVTNLLLLYFLLMPIMLQTTQNIEFGSTNLVYCRIHFYFSFIFTSLSPCYLILTSIDRILATSRNIRLRQLISRDLMCRCILCLTLFWSLFHIHALFYTEIIEFSSKFMICYFQRGLYSILVGYYTLIINGLIPLVSYLLFAFLMIRNVHQQQVRPFISSYQSENRRRTQNDRQFIRMLLIEILICIICDFLQPSMLLYKEITKTYKKNDDLLAIENFLISISIFVLHIPFCCSFYTNILVSTTFRKIVKSILWRNAC